MAQALSHMVDPFPTVHTMFKQISHLDLKIGIFKTQICEDLAVSGSCSSKELGLRWPLVWDILTIPDCLPDSMDIIVLAPQLCLVRKEFLTFVFSPDLGKRETTQESCMLKERQETLFGDKKTIPVFNVQCWYLCRRNHIWLASHLYITCPAHVAFNAANHRC